MAGLLTNGAIFLHIPKTGGTFVRKILDENNLLVNEINVKHCTVDRLYGPNYKVINKVLNIDYSHLAKNKHLFEKDLFSFCFVRNPYSWYESWFKYMMTPVRYWVEWGKRGNVTHLWHPNASLNGLGADDFNTFIENVIQHDPGHLTRLYGQYANAFTTYVGKLESVVDDLIEILRLNNLPFDEKSIRNHPKEHVSDMQPIDWDSDLKKEIYKLEYTIFKKYGYSE